MTPLINSSAGILTILCGIAAFFFWLEHRTQWKLFHFFPPLLFIYMLPAVLSNAGLIEGRTVIPNSAEVYDMLKDYVLPMFLVIMLLKVDVISTVRVMGKGVFVMLLGTTGVILGAPIACWLFKGVLPPETWKAFGTLAGSWIGGTGNMAAVAGGLEVSDSPQFGLAVLGDNLVYIAWLPILLSSKNCAAWFNRVMKVNPKRIQMLESVEAVKSSKAEPLKMRHFLYLFGLGFAAIWVSNELAGHLKEFPPILTTSTWKILLITTIGLGLSLTPARKIPASHELAMALVYVFVANMGAKADVSGLAGSAGWFVLACYVWIAIHGAFCLLGAWLFRVDVHSTAIASAANIGGAASAPIVAAHHNDKLVPVSVLMALIGYAVGNYGAFLAAYLCSWVAG